MASPQHRPPTIPINGQMVRELRMLAGYNLVPFAEQCGISFGYLSQLERGIKPRVSPATYARICDALGVEDRQTLVAA